MSLLKNVASRIDGAGRATRRPVSWAEEALRNGVETFMRARWPRARVIHELVMDRGSVRADVCAIGESHLVATEIKSGYDGTDRLINQIAMFRLAVPELWLFADERHYKDARLLGYLVPTLGYATCSEVEAREASSEDRAINWIVEREAAPFRPDPEALLSLLWVAELTEEAVAARLISPPRSKPPRHSALVAICSEKLTDEEMLIAVCRQLRRRDAEWRADSPIAAPNAKSAPPA